MKKVAVFCGLLVLGLLGSQTLPLVIPENTAGPVKHVLTALTMWMLAFIMIHVGYEFDVDKKNLKPYGWDYVVAMTAAAFPWIFVTLYFLFVMLPAGSYESFQAWKETLLSGRFAAPTSAGVLFSMLAAAGLSATWMFRKTRVLAIFDDLDTVLLMIPLKVMMVGLAWQLGGITVLMAVLLFVGWKYLHRVRMPITWPWVLGYAVIIVGVSEVIYHGSKLLDDTLPIHIEILLPAFVLGCVVARPPGHDPHADDAREGHQEGPESESEQRVSTIVSSCFMVLVGLSMPAILTSTDAVAMTVTGSQPMPGWGTIAVHVLAVTAISNLGKMFPLFCYLQEATWKERLAVSIAMWPRGEVGAGILIVSLSYGIGGPILTVALLSLALNISLTGVFILWVKCLLSNEASAQAAVSGVT